MTQTKAGFTVIAEFQIMPGELEAFLELAHEDARRSLADEAGCHQFDVLTDETDPTRVVLYECYTDRKAFETHLDMPHYAPFKSASTPLLSSPPNVRFFIRA